MSACGTNIAPSVTHALHQGALAATANALPKRLLSLPGFEPEQFARLAHEPAVHGDATSVPEDQQLVCPALLPPRLAGVMNRSPLRGDIPSDLQLLSQEPSGKNYKSRRLTA
jgi:hypothetical protein